ncbi:MAG: Arm DNA-binding domain-containing protein [Actinomycetota bacterium]|nr:Arm DNA-binding domain-containing protein [Actinomycetota bacterium]
MRGYVYKRCTRCPNRARYREGDRRCPKCRATDYVWYYQVDIGQTADGKRKRSNKGGFSTRREAEQAMRDVIAKVERGHIVEASKLTVAQFLRDEWLPSMQMSIEPTTWDGYREKIHSYVLPRVGEIARSAMPAGVRPTISRTRTTDGFVLRP